MRDMILTRCNFKDNNYGGAFINITSENNIESNIGINMEYRTHINTRDSNIRIGGETTLISNYTPIYIDSYVTI